MKYSCMKTLILNHDEVKELLPMSECIDIMEGMFKEIVAGKARFPRRLVIPLPHGNSALAVMPALVPDGMGAKIITVYPGNSQTKFESHQGAILLFETHYGKLIAVIDATSVTGIRTAAVSAVATKALSREDSSRLAILGSGAQSITHLEAVSAVREISTVRVWSRNFERAKNFAGKYGKNIIPARSVIEAVEGADIICTATSSTEPILKGEWIPQGAHINAVGACTSTSRELDSEAVSKSLLFVDSRDSALSEAGDFLIPRSEGLFTDSHIKGELGELLAGKVGGRTDRSQITLFKSLGLATEDLATALALHQRALSESRGSWVEFSKEREMP